jgi:hypothetical protein
MTADQSAGTPPDARADRAPPLHRGRPRPAVFKSASTSLILLCVLAISYIRG